MRIFSIVAAVLSLLAVPACTASPSQTAMNASTPLKSARADVNESICLGGQTFQGCCSKKSGVKDIRGASLLCNNGSESPSCTADISALLPGCCSGHDGIEGTRTDGAVTCKDGSISPSCYIGGCETSSRAD